MAGKKRSGFSNDRRAYNNCCNSRELVGPFNPVPPIPPSPPVPPIPPIPPIPSCVTPGGCLNGYPINIYANCNLNPYQLYCKYYSQGIVVFLLSY